MFRFAPILALVAGILLSAQGAPTLPGWPPGTFSSRAALDATVSGHAMVTALLSASGNTAGPSNSVVNYAPFVQSIAITSYNGTTATRDTPIASAGTINNLTIRVGNAVASGTWAFTLEKNDADTLLTCSITGSAQACADTTHSVSVVAGDVLSWKTDPGGTTPTAQTVLQIGTVFTSTNNGESFIQVPYGGGASTAAVQYQGVAPIAPSATEVNVSSVVPTAGTLDQLYVWASTAPGASKNWTVTVYHGGSATSLVCTMTGTGSANQKCNDTNTGHAFTVAANDLISIRVCPGTESGGVCTVNTPGAANVTASLRWVPTVPGEAMYFMNSATLGTVTTAAYANLNGGGFNNSGTEANNYDIAPNAATLKKLFIQQSTDPGNTITRTYTVRKNTASAGITCTITGNGSTGTSCNDTSNSYLTSLNDTLDLQTTASNTTAAQSYVKAGIVAYIP
jgi:hypothetical protein